MQLLGSWITESAKTAEAQENHQLLGCWLEKDSAIIPGANFVHDVGNAMRGTGAAPGGPGLFKRLAERQLI